MEGNTIQPESREPNPIHNGAEIVIHASYELFIVGLLFIQLINSILWLVVNDPEQSVVLEIIGGGIGVFLLLELEALVKFTDEELKHQELFRRIDSMMAEVMPAGYRFLPDPNEVAGLVLGKSSWAVLGLTCDIELFTQAHYRQSIAHDPELSELWRDVFRYHWQEESQHAILDELEWMREDAKLTMLQRDRAVNDLIELVGAVDGLLQMQSAADADYFFAASDTMLQPAEMQAVRDTFLRAYRWQYIVSGVQDERFGNILADMINRQQAARIERALAPIIDF